MKPIFMVLVFVSASFAGCLSSEDSSSSQVEAIFDFDPSNSIRTGMEIEFDGGASLPTNGGLTYKWDFENDGAYDETGRTATWSYANAGTYEVTLTVSDGTNSNSQTRTLKVADADAQAPKADAGSYSPNSDCEGDSLNSGTFYLVYICEMDKSTSSKSILATTTVNLDASNSEPCEDENEPCDDYISEYNWDLDLLRDEDGDGDPENDADLTGETVEWKELSPGEYRISLTVINGEGLASSTMLSFTSIMLESGAISQLVAIHQIIRSTSTLVSRQPTTLHQKIPSRKRKESWSIQKKIVTAQMSSQVTETIVVLKSTSTVSILQTKRLVIQVQLALIREVRRIVMVIQIVF